MNEEMGFSTKVMSNSLGRLNEYNDQDRAIDNEIEK